MALAKECCQNSELFLVFAPIAHCPLNKSYKVLSFLTIPNNFYSRIFYYFSTTLSIKFSLSILFQISGISYKSVSVLLFLQIVSSLFLYSFIARSSLLSNKYLFSGLCISSNGLIISFTNSSPQVYLSVVALSIYFFDTQ